ncbi:MAG TPA: TIGR00730 family Rossman fold protein [Polyangiales bacterium]|nr:TIGR00730 family Rossman fold protein [Polyangiales bacterium]
MTRLCVFCGSAFGVDRAYIAAARALAEAMHARGLGLVYGGAKRGLMGVLADAVLELGGEVIGVIPRSLVEREIAHDGLSELIVVHSMHERKAVMAERAAGFLALPGGFGTLEEFLEVVTWAQLGLHDKPLALLSAADYFEGLLTFIRHMTRQGFVSPHASPQILVGSEPAELLDRMFGFA